MYVTKKNWLRLWHWLITSLLFTTISIPNPKHMETNAETKTNVYARHECIAWKSMFKDMKTSGLTSIIRTLFSKFKPFANKFYHTKIAFEYAYVCIEMQKKLISEHINSLNQLQYFRPYQRERVMGKRKNDHPIKRITKTVAVAQPRIYINCL